MKFKLLLFAFGLFFSPLFVLAQWTGTTNIYNTNAGNVGIGTTNPTNQLQIGSVEGTGYSGNAIAIGDGTNVIAMHYGTTGYLVANGNLAIGAATNFTNQLFLKSNGNVGIGTASPTYKLDIVASDYSNLRLTANLPLLKLSSPMYNSGNGAEIWQNTNGNVYFNANSSTTGFMFNPSGNVGIGTNQPDQKLTVNGTIHATEVKVTATVPVPDYVFDNSYQLKRLTELQEYINKNKHLPEIPSAAEIEKSGINLSEMNLKLLKKVEELTLYLIEKDKQLKVEHANNTVQQSQIQAQQSQIDQLKQLVETINKKIK